MTTAPDKPTADPSSLRGGSAIAVAVVLMNVATYAFTMVSARLLGPRDYGAFAAVMNVLLVSAVLALALQATAARRISREPRDLPEVEDAILLVGRRSAIALGVIFAIAAPVIDRALRLDSLATALLLAVAVVPTTMMGSQAGVLQGERRWTSLAIMYLAAGVPRFLIGTLLVVVHPNEMIAVLGVAISAFAPVVVGSITLHRLRLERDASRADNPPEAGAEDHSARALWWETVYNSQALLAFLMLSNLDIVLARNALDRHDAGLYAGGLIMVKAVLFLPQFVVVLAFPSMGSDDARRSALTGSLGLVVVVGAAVTGATWLLSGLALVFVGGSEYSGIQDQLWAFAVLGTLLSMLQLLVYSVLARQAHNSVVLLWIALGVMIFLGLHAHSVSGLLTRVSTVDAVLFAVLLAVSLWRLRLPVPATTAEPAASL